LTRVVVLVPRRADHGPRDRLWRFVRAHWEDHHPFWVIHEGHHDEGLFNRSAAINLAASEAGEWDLAVVVDADTLVGPQQVAAALAVAWSVGRFTLAYDNFCYLNRRGTEKVLRGYLGAWEPYVEWSMPGTCSSAVVVTRELWAAVGGFDPGFVGWGMEDVAFSLACQALGDGLERIPGPIWHLHHPPSAENADTPAFRANIERLERYRSAQGAGTPQAMTAVLRQLGRVP
jgi:GT2 family glycosyltransferase